MLRPAELSDCQSLRAFAERTFREAWEAQNDPLEFSRYCAQAFDADAFLAEMKDPGSRFFIWEHSQGDIIAYLKLNYNRLPPEWAGQGNGLQIERIYVDQNAQGQGIGAAMLAFAEQEAKLSGADILWLSVWEKSPRAVAFYRRYGFEQDGLEIFWVGNDPQTDYLMRKSLTGE